MEVPVTGDGEISEGMKRIHGAIDTAEQTFAPALDEKGGVDPKPKGNCFNCHKEVSGDHFCHGCKSYVCDDCENGFSKAQATRGRTHEPGDHLIDSEADDDDEEGIDED